jgi:AraC-like DNA-binding protein
VASGPRGSHTGYGPYGRYVTRGLPSEMCAGQRPVRPRSPRAPRCRRAGMGRVMACSPTSPRVARQPPVDRARTCCLQRLSRPAFAQGFQQALRLEPIQYRTEWRMTLARDHLRSGDLRSHPGRRRPRKRRAHPVLKRAGTREGAPAAGTTYQERQF